MSFVSKLRRDNDALFNAALTHPFVTGIGDGSLPTSYFERWLTQDWLYLKGYLRAIQAAADLADTPDAQRFFSTLVDFTQKAELDHHEDVAATFGITRDTLNATEPYAATTAYLNVLASARTSYPALVATLTPCAIGYGEIAAALNQRGPSPVPEYQAWIDSYNDPAFQDTIVQFTNELGSIGADSANHAICAQAYTQAATCELEFWNGLWSGC